MTSSTKVPHTEGLGRRVYIAKSSLKYEKKYLGMLLIPIIIALKRLRQKGHHEKLF